MFVPPPIARKNFAVISTKIYEKPTTTGFRLAGPRDNPTTGALLDDYRYCALRLARNYQRHPTYSLNLTLTLDHPSILPSFHPSILSIVPGASLRSAPGFSCFAPSAHRPFAKASLLFTKKLEDPRHTSRPRLFIMFTVRIFVNDEVIADIIGILFLKQFDHLAAASCGSLFD